MKIVIIGNSGSGKTWLAEKLCNEKIKLFHLDQFYWEPDGFDIRRGKAEIKTMIKKSLQNTEWVVEGVFGELIKYYTPEAKELIWLDVPWALCHKRLIKRGSESKRHMNRTSNSRTDLKPSNSGVYKRSLRKHLTNTIVIKAKFTLTSC